MHYVKTGSLLRKWKWRLRTACTVWTMPLFINKYFYTLHPLFSCFHIFYPGWLEGVGNEVIHVSSKTYWYFLFSQKKGTFISRKLCKGGYMFVWSGLNVAFNNLSIISWRCLDETGSSMLTFRVLPHWNIMPQTLWHDIPPSHIILTLSWPDPIPSSTFLMLSAKRKSS